MKILLTGGTGFLGSHLAERLVVEKHELAIIKRSTSSLKRLARIEGKCLLLDIDKMGVDGVFEAFIPDVIIHTAASYGRNEVASQVVASNLIFPLQLLDAAIKNGVSTFINTDTSLPATTNTYALAKKQFAQWLAFHQDKIQGINVVSEYFYGARDDEWKFITMLIRKMLRHQDIDLGDGLPERDFIYIDDAVEAYIYLLQNISVGSRYENIGLGSGKAIQLKKLVLLCQSLIGNTTSKLNFGKFPTRPKEVMFSQADTSFLNKLGWQTQYSLEEGIMKTIKQESELL